MFRKLILLLVLTLVAGAAWLGRYGSHPVTPPQLPVTFLVPSGNSLRSLSHTLEAKGVIEHPAAFVLLARVLGNDGKIKAGGYLIDKPVSPYRLLNMMISGENRINKVTIPEGWSLRQMRVELDGRSDIRHDSLTMDDEQLLKAIGAGGQHAEGLFFPDTYYYGIGESDLAIYRKAFATMQKHLDAAWQGRAAGLPYQTPYQALIMASIVEKETGAPEERPLIAGVFLNRLRIGMPLQTDPTVIYGMGDRYDGYIHKADLETDTAYNTYTRRGLPPTPIALPGEAAIQAALHPENSKALYFVAKGDGHHQFSDTLEEHNRAVYRYQIKGSS